MPTLIKDLIDIPERVHRGDFVLKLADGLARADETVRSYVATPQLERCFDEVMTAGVTFVSEGLTVRRVNATAEATGETETGATETEATEADATTVEPEPDAAGSEAVSE